MFDVGFLLFLKQNEIFCAAAVGVKGWVAMRHIENYRIPTILTYRRNVFFNVNLLCLT